MSDINKKSENNIIFAHMGIRKIEELILPKSILDLDKEYFSFSVTGNGMINIGIQDGDIVVFETTDFLENGDIGCFIVDGQPMCKRYFFNKEYNLHILQFEDGKQAPILVNNKQNFKILGKLAMKMNRM